MANEMLLEKGRKAYGELKDFLKAKGLRLEVSEMYPHNLIVIGDNFEYCNEEGDDWCDERDSIYDDWDENKEYGAGTIQ